MLNVVMDRYTSQILLGTANRAKGIRELSREYNIPLTVCYRRVKKLAEIGLLKEEKIGKRAKYISKIEDFRATLNFEENKLTMNMVAGGEKYHVEGNIL